MRFLLSHFVFLLLALALATYGVSSAIWRNVGRSGSVASAGAMDTYCAAGNVWKGESTDGPAGLPTSCVFTDPSATPTLGAVTKVNTSDLVDLQKKINAAGCGDTLVLQGIYAGHLTLPKKPCTDNAWIVLRSAWFTDSRFPPYGTRALPCHFNVTSLPGRPAFACASGVHQLGARLVYGDGNLGPITFATGANHYRIMGLEITRPVRSGGCVTALVDANNASDHIIFDRVWVHGSSSTTSQDETRRAFAFGIGVSSSGVNYWAVIDSYVNDIYCVNSIGECTDAQAIGAGDTSTAAGPFKVVNNFLEASAETLMFGGAETAGSQKITNGEIRRNHLFKPLTWNPSDPSYNGGVLGHPVGVKNLLEFKNGDKILVQGNILENAWNTVEQLGFAVLITARGGNIKSTCVIPNASTCGTTNITIRYNRSKHTSTAVQIANSGDPGPPMSKAAPGNHYSIHDNIFDDLCTPTTNCDSRPNRILQFSAAAPLYMVAGSALHDLSFVHNTLATDNFDGSPAPVASAWAMIDGPKARDGNQSYNLIYRDNISDAGFYGAFGGYTNCGGPISAAPGAGRNAWDACFASYVLDYNVWTKAASATWGFVGLGTHNILKVANMEGVRFVNYNAGVNGDYHLQPTSPGYRAASDGKNIGADVDAVNGATLGVE